MKIKNVSLAELRRALRQTNKIYDGNLICNWQKVGRHFEGVLQVKDSHGRGAHLAISGRHTTLACWHAHGDFFADLLQINSSAEVKTMRGIISAAGGNWQDWQEGGLLNGRYASELCQCSRQS